MSHLVADPPLEDHLCVIEVFCSSFLELYCSLLEFFSL